MLRFLTSGESHGASLLAILEGMMAGVQIREEEINRDLERRQQGFGRGGRMSIEKDKIEILSGLKNGVTLGSPIAIRIMNRDFKIDQLPRITKPRPGHADLAGALKYDRRDVRDVLERSSARETAARVAVGSICKQLLRRAGIDMFGHVISIGGVAVLSSTTKSFKAIKEDAERSPVRCHDRLASKKMVQKIQEVKNKKDTLGGVFEVQIKGIPAGIGAYVNSENRLSARLAFGLMSIQAVKGFEIVSGIEDGASDGRLIILRAAMKPIATLMKPLKTIDIGTKKTALATIERSDVTAVPACAVVAEAMVAFEFARFYHDIIQTSNNLKRMRL